MFASLFWALASFIIVIIVVTSVHEAGHFVAGRLLGAPIEAFSIGIGPEIMRRTDKNGIVWRLAAFPIGGYVKFTGDSDPAGLAKSSGLDAMPVWRRAFVVAAGPLANVVLAVALFTTTFVMNGRFTFRPVIDQVEAGTPAETAGLKPGDLIVTLDGSAISDAQTFIQNIRIDGIVQHRVTVARAGTLTPVALTITPVFSSSADPYAGPVSQPRIGVSFRMDNTTATNQRCDAPSCLAWGISRTAEIARATFVYLRALVMARQSADGLSGPVAIAYMGGNIARSDALELIPFIAAISLSLGIANLLPIPLLDGGHLVFYAYEAIARRRPSGDFKLTASKVGLGCVGALMIFAFFRDITRLFF